MPQSLSKVILHIIFSTKNRERWLDSAIRPHMHAYLATICRDLGSEASFVGGVTDHVHIVMTLPRALSQSDLIEAIKKPSSHSPLSESCCASTASSLMSNMCGIEGEGRLSRAFSANTWFNLKPGALPQARAEKAPLALDTGPPLGRRLG